MAHKRKQQYLGDREVTTIKDSAIESIITVTFADGSWEDVNRTIFNASVTETPTDLSSLRERRMRPVAQAILEAMLEYNVQEEEVQYLLAVVLQSLEEHMKEANARLWARTGESKRDLTKRTLLDIDSILKGSHNESSSPA